MSRIAVVDTAVLVGFVDTDDRHHDGAAEIVRGMDAGTLPTGHVTDYVLLETLNWIHSRHHGKARETYARLNESAGFEIHHTPQKDASRALELFDTYEGLSFGDASIVAYMDRREIEYLYSFDDDFDAVDGLIRLNVAEDPFE